MISDAADDFGSHESRLEYGDMLEEVFDVERLQSRCGVLRRDIFELV